jgi:hypothetical protein
MFKVEMLRRVGLAPIVVEDISQLVVRLPDGSIVSLAGVFGPDNAVLVSHCADPNFKDDLKRLALQGNPAVIESTFGGNS